MIEPADAAALRAVLLKDLESLSRIENYAASILMNSPARAEIESLGFAMHNFYNALANSFSQISLSFENHVKEKARWRRELLEKMFLATPPLRPAVLPDSSHPFLSDLLAFRHFFRHSYEFTLDPVKTLALARQWAREGGGVKTALQGFAERLVP